MEKFEYKGYKYDILDTFNTTNVEGYTEFEVKRTSKSFVKDIFPIFPIIIGGKFRWLKKCKVKYRLYFSRKQSFDDGWSYSFYWTPWIHEIRIEKIVD
ncbi:MAG: hypothetical protein ACOCVF_03160 [bacterium]